LEIRRPEYTERFGTATRSHVLDVDPANPEATVIADLCRRGALGPGAYDCVILTQTLQFLAEPRVAVESLYAALRPGGTLLITVPCAARIDHEAPEGDLWRLTPAGLRSVLERWCRGAEIELEAGGSLRATLAVMLGLAAEELTPAELAEHDPAFPVIACAAVKRP
jgi:SAM-dependent methyltransferase